MFPTPGFQIPKTDSNAGQRNDQLSTVSKIFLAVADGAAK
jgi:hypothetical protein